jgi:carbon-monoxide dehydrogenase medium subunit
MCNATPSADTAPALIALGASAKISGGAGERSISLEEFFKAPGQTVLSADEILTEIIIPRTPAGLVGEYIKFSPREMMDLAYVGVAVAYDFEPQKRTCAGVRIVLGAVAPTPIRAKRAEATVEGQALSESLAEKAGNIAAEEAKPISDVRSTADYRRAMVAAMTKRALLNAAVGPAKSWVERRDRRY